MTVKDVYEAIDGFAPFSSACAFDNCGLMCGDMSAPVSRVLVTLDADLAALAQAESCGCELVVSHHPLIFDPLSAVTPAHPVWSYIRTNVAVISAHTNLDAADGGVNDALAAICRIKAPQKLYEDGVPLGRFGDTGFEGDYVGMLCAALNAHAQCLVTRPVKKVCVVSGSGGSLIESAYAQGCDTLVTGECKHDRFVWAANSGMNVIALGHFETENIVL